MSLRSWLRLLTVIVARIGLSTAAGLLIWAHAPGLVLGWHATVVLGGSMRPHLSPGDVVVYQPLRGRTPKSGQVVVAVDPARPPRLLVHRVGKVLRDGNLITAGDNNPAVDSTPVPPSSVLGLGRLRVPELGLPVAYWRQGDYGFVVASLAALAVMTRLAAISPVRPDRGGHAPPDGHPSTPSDPTVAAPTGR
ncbi:signal peptidase I [Streptomyces jeddahensis]|uniref:Signal peptidase I n=1 Tax=Streptomyces jeddahensis TaxID=1716141 RepID=A0A177HUU9_9ACTN|nr:signal peptidase I [Streptomyces jeddahensis]OAH14496.1 peptidase S24-like protein [Streptomyces jeddahensis]